VRERGREGERDTGGDMGGDGWGMFCLIHANGWAWIGGSGLVNLNLGSLAF
jgi:hypothetical protein